MYKLCYIGNTMTDTTNREDKKPDEGMFEKVCGELCGEC